MTILYTEFTRLGNMTAHSSRLYFAATPTFMAGNFPSVFARLEIMSHTEKPVLGNVFIKYPIFLSCTGTILSTCAYIASRFRDRQDPLVYALVTNNDEGLDWREACKAPVEFIATHGLGEVKEQLREGDSFLDFLCRMEMAKHGLSLDPAAYMATTLSQALTPDTAQSLCCQDI